MSEADPAPEPAPGPERARPALAARLGAAVKATLAGWRTREVQGSARRWQVAAALAALLAAGPLATILGASIYAARARAEARKLEAVAAPRIVADGAVERDRTELAGLLRRPGVGAVIEALARALPPESSLVRAGRDGGGGLTIEIATPDPDKLRSALRSEPLLARLRDSGQRQSEGAMIVTLAEQAR